jgi:putative ABC transport system permease protein
MTAVVAERRREIGLRKAIGASNSSIIKEFMGESMLLGFFGGTVGSVLGYVFASQVSIRVFSSSISFRPLLVPITIIISIIVTGLSSLMPIRSATEVDPALVLKGE